MKHLKIIYLLIISLLYCITSLAQDDIFELSPAEKVDLEQIEKRIKETRMGNIIIRTQKKSDVKIEQIKHEFLFGTAIPSELAPSHPNAINEQDRKKYIEILRDNFNNTFYLRHKAHIKHSIGLIKH